MVKEKQVGGIWGANCWMRTGVLKHGMVGSSLLLLGSNLCFGGCGAQDGRGGRCGAEQVNEVNYLWGRSRQPLLLCGAPLPRLGRVGTFLFGVRVGRGWREPSSCDQGFLDQCRATERKRKAGVGERGRERGRGRESCAYWKCWPQSHIQEMLRVP